MIEQREGCIFEQKDLQYLVQQCNLFHCFGSGIAAEIKKRYPYAFYADQRTVKGDRDKLGTYSTGFGTPTILNVYSQDGIDAKNRTTRYDCLGAALLSIETGLRGYYDARFDKRPITIGIPYKLGCGLGGGAWSVVRPIIDSAFEKSPIKVVICRRSGD